MEIRTYQEIFERENLKFEDYTPLKKLSQKDMEKILLKRFG